MDLWVIQFRCRIGRVDNRTTYRSERYRTVRVDFDIALGNQVVPVDTDWCCRYRIVLRSYYRLQESCTSLGYTMIQRTCNEWIRAVVIDINFVYRLLAKRHHLLQDHSCRCLTFSVGSYSRLDRRYRSRHVRHRRSEIT